ncbi:MAG TPA: RidA family protein [Flavobacteriales bacterium]|nr:RidA family protein [Flavobacteriales bacterium]
MKKTINTSDAPAPIGPYSQAVLANGNLYLSGQIALDPDTGELITDNIIDETHQVMKNIQAIINAAGLNMGQIIKCSIFITNMDDFAEINEVYGTYFNNDPPARETVEVSRLPKNVNVEISVIANG